MSYSDNYQRRERPEREMHDAVCSECKQETKVPFKPDPDRPVYCQTCYQKNRPPRRNRY